MPPVNDTSVVSSSCPLTDTAAGGPHVSVQDATQCHTQPLYGCCKQKGLRCSSTAAGLSRWGEWPLPATSLTPTQSGKSCSKAYASARGRISSSVPATRAPGPRGCHEAGHKSTVGRRTGADCAAP
eukprot:5734302-Prymnesium_polylepis.2